MSIVITATASEYANCISVFIPITQSEGGKCRLVLL